MIIAALTMPISVIGAFTLMYFAGFGINMMSLMALSSSVGLLVTNSIVVLENINNKLNQGLDPKEAAYKGTSEITHFLWVLDKNPDLLKGKITKPLSDLRVAGYYGCHILRPQEIMNHEDGKHPKSLERLIEALGAKSVEFDAKRKCCGFHAQLAAEHDVLTVTGQIVDSANKAEADVLVTPCPLCQMQLDMYEPEGREAVHSQAEVPILHLQQLVGFALGLSKEEVGFNRHVSAQARLKI
jgi:succinate dehydrogenase / fumarate reductase cytochrome b subunit